MGLWEISQRLEISSWLLHNLQSVGRLRLLEFRIE